MVSLPVDRKSTGSGWLCITLYCLFTSLSAVWVSMSFTKISGSALTFFTLLIAQIVFLLFAVIKKQQPLTFLKENKGKIFWLNILTLTSWLFMFMALQRIEASVESAIYQGWIPVVVMLLGLLIARKNQMQVLGPVLIAMSIFALVAARLYVNADGSHTDSRRVIEGVVLASVAGSTGGVYVWLSAGLKNVKGATTMNILATRFIILLLVTGLLARHQLVDIVTTDIHALLQLTFLSLLFVVIPIFCLQHAILELGAPRVSVLTPLVPVIALAAEYLVAPWHSQWVPALIGVVSLSLIISNLRMNKAVKP